MLICKTIEEQNQMVYPKFLLKYKISQNTFIPAYLLPQIPNQNTNISNRQYIQTLESTKLHTHLRSQNPNFQTQTIKSTNLNQTKPKGKDILAIDLSKDKVENEP